MNIALKIAILLFVLIFSAGYLAYLFDGYPGLSDGNDYAGLGRSIIRGEGFCLGHLYPLAFVFNSNIPQPDNIWAPSYPVYLSLWFIVLGDNDTAILMATIFMVWLMIAAAYYCGKTLLGDNWGILAATLVGLNQSVLKVALEGSPEILAGALLAFSYILVTGKGGKYRVILSAVIFAIAVLARYQIAVLAIPFVIFLPRRDLKRAALWVAVMIVSLMPWLVRNYLVLGSPFFTLQTYGEFTKGMGHLKHYYLVYRSFEPVTLGYALGNFPFYVFKKFAAGIVFFALNIPAVLNFFGIIPLAYAVRKIFILPDIRMRFIGFTMISSAIIVLLSSFDGQHWRHIVNLQVLLTVSIVAGVMMMLENMAIWKRKFMAALLVAAMFFPARFPFQEKELSNTAATVRDDKLKYETIAKETGPGDVVISDASDAVWWYADRLSVWIPVRYGDVVKVMDMAKADYVYLANMSEYFSGLSDEDLADFHTRMIQVDGVAGGWGLFRRNQNQGLI